MKTNVYVLCGGKSAEHEISLKSASAIRTLRTRINIMFIQSMLQGKGYGVPRFIG